MKATKCHDDAKESLVYHLTMSLDEMLYICTRCGCRKNSSEAWELKELLKDQQEDAEEGFENTMQNKDLKEDPKYEKFPFKFENYTSFSLNFLY